MKLPRPPSAPLTLVVGLLVLLLAAPATASFSSSTSFGYVITTGTWGQPDEDEDKDTEPDPSDPDDGDEEAEGSKVWVCKLTGPPDAPTLKAGPNPIEVAAAATNDDRLDDKHGSPVVEDAGTDCDAVFADLMEHAEDPPPQPEASKADDAALSDGEHDAHGHADEQHDTAHEEDVEDRPLESPADISDEVAEEPEGTEPVNTSEPDGGEDQ